MKLIQLHADVNGIRFFKKFSKRLEIDYLPEQFIKTKFVSQFLRILDDNSAEYDVALLFIHGGNNGFLLPIREKERVSHPERFDKVIGVDQAKLFINDLVIAIACYTAKGFGPKAIENGAIAYLGYDNSIEGVFSVKNLSINKKIRNFYENEIKNIYVDSLYDSLYKFINSFQTVEMFKQSFALLFDKRVNALLNMRYEELKEKYRLKVDKGTWKKQWPKIKMAQLQILNDMSTHLVLLGDENYISLIGLSGNIIINDKIKNRLCNMQFKNKSYELEFKKQLSDYFGKISTFSNPWTSVKNNDKIV